MSEIEPLIADLALILICAGVMTLVFKKLRQPLVLGYIVAGFIASPHFALTPSVLDAASIHTWSDIGVIFLLFALGLEFSFKKIVKVGGPAVIAALTIISGMIFLGFTVGSAFGWKKMDAQSRWRSFEKDVWKSKNIIFQARPPVISRTEPVM